MDYSKLDDVTLMGLMAQDRTEALGELYDRYNRLVFSLALAIVGDDATADEITLDVFLRLWRNYSECGPGLGSLPPRTWNWRAR